MYSRLESASMSLSAIAAATHVNRLMSGSINDGRILLTVGKHQSGGIQIIYELEPMSLLASRRRRNPR